MKSLSHPTEWVLRGGTAPVSLPGSGEVHVWSFALERPPAELAALAAVLDDSERTRAASYHFPHLRADFVAARGLLRCILASYIDRDPAALRFACATFGKPSLAGYEELFFNLSHRAGSALCAVTIDGPVGVDVEAIRPLDYDTMARTAFSPKERRWLAACATPRLLQQAFFRCWTRKEAYIKARGGGLSIPLDSFDVPLATAVQLQLVESRESVAAAHGWYVTELDVGPTAKAAVALRQPHCRIVSARLEDR